MSLHGKLPLAGREKISSRVRWCFRFIQHSTAYWYQVRLPFRCMQDTDNARHHLAAESMAGEGRLTVAAQVNGHVG